jgi:glutamate N-acetyltransferase/amino-acid N-acetyltransferase
LIVGEGNATGVFTANRVKSASSLVTQEHLASERLSAIIANSGCANTFTGEEGGRNAERMAELVAEEFGFAKNGIAVASTGIIGQQLDMGRIEHQFRKIVEELESSAAASENAARAIMTTDTFTKGFALGIGGCTIGAIAKGAGMIAPNMGTLLSFIYTDADLSSRTLRRCLRRAVDKSFNMVVVDGDTSTNDMVLLTATGEKDVNEETFQWGLNALCITLARMIASDGEGATKLITVNVTRARSEDDARKAARAIIRSPLFKCAVFGEDLNWGRIIAAIGNSHAREIEPSRISLKIRGVTIVEDGEVKVRMGTNVKDAENMMRGKEIVVDVDLGVGMEKATSWGCDLSYDYVRLNSKQ